MEELMSFLQLAATRYRPINQVLDLDDLLYFIIDSNYGLRTKFSFVLAGRGCACVLNATFPKY